MWLACLAITAITLQHEHVDGSSYFSLFIPFEGLHFQLRDSIQVSKTQIDLYLIDESDRTLYHELFTFSIELHDRDLIRRSAYPIIFRLDQVEGEIDGHIKISNMLQGTRQNVDFPLRPPYPELPQTTPLYIFQKDSNRFVTQFPFNGACADSLTIIQHYAAAPDSIHVLVDDSIVWRQDRPSKNLRAVMPVEDRLYDGIHVHTYYGEECVSSHDREPYYSLYDNRYPPEVQIRQLELIMLSADIHDARSVEDDEIGDYIRDYWKRNDPTPDTEYNENREMFIQRVLDADRRFSLKGFIPGWRTDQGRILIKYGEPEYEHVESFPNDAQYPYIIWYYYSMDKRFIFYDKKGFGYYELTEKWYIDRD